MPASYKLLERLKEQITGRWCITIIFDKLVPQGGYPATIFARLTLDSKLMQGFDPAAIMAKEIVLSGV